jgi:rhodanese-related sulfurtransferase
MELVRGGTEAARFALAHQVPRKVSAVAKDRVRFIRVDSAYVNQPNEVHNNVAKVATYEVSDLPDEAGEDWMTTLLKSPLFQRLPPANLQNMLGLFEEVAVRAGQEIIHQDEVGDYYYVIKRGRCALTRRPSPNAKEIKLGELKTSDTFGEDALISEQPRNVSVTMLTEGALLRLDKANFLKLVKEPVIAYVNLATALPMLEQGAKWIDVRSMDEFERGHLPNAINIPFFRLRMEIASLERRCKYILVCETGRISEAAAFQLLRFSFDAYVLKGGIASVPKENWASGDLSVGFAPLRPAAQQELPPPAPKPALSLLQLEAGEEEIEAAPPPPAPGSTPPSSEESPRSLSSLSEQQLARARELLEGLKKENIALKSELTSARADIAKLQAKVKELYAKESDARGLLQRLEAEAEAGRERMQLLTAENASLKELQAGGGAPGSEAFEEQARRLRELEISYAMAKTDLQNSVEENEHLERELKDLMDLRAGMQLEDNAPPQAPADAPRKIAALEAEKADLSEELRAALQQIEELEKHAAQLSALLQEFVDKQSEGEDVDEIKSLNTELEMVRIQANADVMTLQTRLRAAEQELSALKKEQEAARGKLAQPQSAPPPTARPPEARSEKPKLSRGVVYAVLLLVLLLAFALIATEQGQSLLRNLLG